MQRLSSQPLFSGAHSISLWPTSDLTPHPLTRKLVLQAAQFAAAAPFRPEHPSEVPSGSVLSSLETDLLDVGLVLDGPSLLLE